MFSPSFNALKTPNNNLPATLELPGAFQAFQTARGFNSLAYDTRVHTQESDIIKMQQTFGLLTTLKTLGGGLAVGLLNLAIFRIPAYFAIGAEMIIGFLESLFLSGLVLWETPLNDRIIQASNRLFQRGDKSLSEMSVEEKQSALAPLNATVSVLSTCLITALCFFKSSEARAHYLHNLKLLLNPKTALPTLISRPARKIAASLAGGFGIGYIEGVGAKWLTNYLRGEETGSTQ